MEESKDLQQRKTKKNELMRKMCKKAEAQKKIKSLIDRFDRNIAQYKKTNYDEANTRVDFIDPFFEALGWDVANKQGYAEQYREVVREDKLMVNGDRSKLLNF